MWRAGLSRRTGELLEKLKREGRKVENEERRSNRGVCSRDQFDPRPREQINFLPLERRRLLAPACHGEKFRHDCAKAYVDPPAGRGREHACRHKKLGIIPGEGLWRKIFLGPGEKCARLKIRPKRLALELTARTGSVALSPLRVSLYRSLSPGTLAEPLQGFQIRLFSLFRLLSYEHV